MDETYPFLEAEIVKLGLGSDGFNLFRDSNYGTWCDPCRLQLTFVNVYEAIIFYDASTHSTSKAARKGFYNQELKDLWETYESL